MNFLRSAAQGARVLLGLGLAACFCVQARAGYNSDLLVSDLNTGKLFAFDSASGALQGTFGGSPYLTNPRGIAVGQDGNIYAGDALSNAVQEFDGTTGAFIKTFVPAGSHGLSYIYGMIFDPSGNLYVASANSNTVVEFASDGTYLRTFGAGSPLAGTTGLAFGPDGKLYVASSLSSQILVFDPATGNYLGTFGPQIYQISGLAFGNGHLYVASGIPGSNAFGILNLDGSVFASFNDTMHLLTPGGMVVGPDTKLYIASYGNGNVVRYNADGSYDTTLVQGSGVGLSGPIYVALAGVPEPSSVALLGVGALGIAVIARRRSATAS
jgi:streptogramin lyase